ncbi:MAG TPA: hypothetical protein VFN10_23185 [Thermoanaerobaculia bacterium]|nr:hypothetical protein [Thermoanaerobaculia bacterium]
MSDPVLALILIVAFFAAIVAAHYFKTLDGALFHDARTPLIAGVVAGVLIRFADRTPHLHALVVGVVLTLAALYVRLTGRESEPIDGMTLGAMTGVAAAIPLAFSGEGELRQFAECILAGAVAGYGITFGLTHVADKLRQLIVDAITAAAAVGAAYAPTVAMRSGAAERHVAITAAALLPLIVIGTVFKQWPAIRAELRHEASLGVIDEEDVRPTAHPFRRLGRAGWHDASAHREFVRIANKIALRKRQQRGRAEEIARLYQVEVIKLRMQAQGMAQVDRAMRNAALRGS